MYWAEARAARVRRVRYEGGAAELVAQFPSNHHPVALAVYNDSLYWLDTWVYNNYYRSVWTK